MVGGVFLLEIIGLRTMRSLLLAMRTELPKVKEKINLLSKVNLGLGSSLGSTLPNPSCLALSRSLSLGLNLGLVVKGSIVNGLVIKQSTGGSKENALLGVWPRANSQLMWQAKTFHGSSLFEEGASSFARPSLSMDGPSPSVLT